MTFPAINLELNIPRVAFSIFGVNVYWYGVIIVSAMVIALLLCKKDDGKYGIEFKTILDLAIYVIPISIICARIYYVVFNFSIYENNIMRVFDFRTGGLAIYGGIIGAVITIYVYCKLKKVNFIDILDYVVPFLALGQSIGRWGNFVNIEAYGTETTFPWRMGIFEGGIYKEVHPTFLYESISTFLIFVLLYLIRNNRKYKGQITYIYLALYGVARMIIEGLRIDSLMYQNLRISQALSLLLFVIFSGVLVYKKICYNKSSKNDENRGWKNTEKAKNLLT